MTGASMESSNRVGRRGESELWELTTAGLSSLRRAHRRSDTVTSHWSSAAIGRRPVSAFEQTRTRAAGAGRPARRKQRAPAQKGEGDPLFCCQCYSRRQDGLRSRRRRDWTGDDHVTGPATMADRCVFSSLLRGALRWHGYCVTRRKT